VRDPLQTARGWSGRQPGARAAVRQRHDGCGSAAAGTSGAGDRTGRGRGSAG